LKFDVGMRAKSADKKKALVTGQTPSPPRHAAAAFRSPLSRAGALLLSLSLFVRDLHQIILPALIMQIRTARLKGELQQTHRARRGGGGVGVGSPAARARLVT
jgi:hypothetical protein